MFDSAATSAAPSAQAEQVNAPDGAVVDELLSELRVADRAIARAVTLAGLLAGSGVCERVEGLPLDLLLGLQARLIGCDRGMLITAGDCLQSMPVTDALFADGALSWGQVRAIVGRARRLNRDQRAQLDARIAATVDELGGLDLYSPDELLAAVDVAADEIHGAREVERRERRAELESFLAVQSTFDGGATIFGQLSTFDAAAVLRGLDDAAGPPAGAGQPTEPGQATTRAKQRAQGLVKMAGAWLGDGNTKPAKPLLLVHLDTAHTTITAAGLVELNAPGHLAPITRRAIEHLLNNDPQLRLVLFDRQRPLAVSAKLDLTDVPDDIRLAVRARDRGDRMPGSRAPAAHCDIHHIVERADGGDHHPDLLTLLSRPSHTLIHRHGWRIHLDPDTGVITIRRRGRTYRSLPRGTPLARPTHPPPAWQRPAPTQPRVIALHTP